MFRDRSHRVFVSKAFVEIRKSMSLVAVYTPKEPYNLKQYILLAKEQ